MPSCHSCWHRLLSQRFNSRKTRQSLCRPDPHSQNLCQGPIFQTTATIGPTLCYQTQGARTLCSSHSSVPNVSMVDTRMSPGVQVATYSSQIRWSAPSDSGVNSSMRPCRNLTRPQTFSCGDFEGLVCEAWSQPARSKINDELFEIIISTLSIFNHFRSETLEVRSCEESTEVSVALWLLVGLSCAGKIYAEMGSPAGFVSFIKWTILKLYQWYSNGCRLKMVNTLNNLLKISQYWFR